MCARWQQAERGDDKEGTCDKAPNTIGEDPHSVISLYYLFPDLGKCPPDRTKNGVIGGKEKGEGKRT